MSKKRAAKIFNKYKIEKTYESAKEFIDIQPRMFKWTRTLSYSISCSIYYARAIGLKINPYGFYVTKTWKEFLPLQKKGLVKIVKNRANNEYYIFIRKKFFISLFELGPLSDSQIDQMTQ